MLWEHFPYLWRNFQYKYYTPIRGDGSYEYTTCYAPSTTAIGHNRCFLLCCSWLFCGTPMSMACYSNLIIPLALWKHPRAPEGITILIREPMVVFWLVYSRFPSLEEDSPPFVMVRWLYPPIWQMGQLVLGKFTHRNCLAALHKLALYFRLQCWLAHKSDQFWRDSQLE